MNRIFLLCNIIFLISCNTPDSPFVFDPSVTNPTDKVFQSFEAPFSVGDGNRWTIFIYMDGANDLEQPGIEDFHEMEYGLYLSRQSYPDILDYLNIIVLYDRIAGHSALPQEDWTDTRLFKVLPDSDSLGSIVSEEIFDSAGEFGFSTGESASVERNMAHPDTLKNFIDFGIDRFPADHYGIILWGHGTGPFSSIINNKSKSKGISPDEEEGNGDELSIEEVQQAFKSSTLISGGKLFDLMGFDACLMGSAEIGYEFKDIAKVMTASMSNEVTDGWNYSGLFGSFSHSDSGAYSSGEHLGKAIVKAFYEINKGKLLSTLAAVKLSYMEDLKIHMDVMASRMYESNKKNEFEQLRDNTIAFYTSSDFAEKMNWPYFDLNDFCYKIIGNYSLFSQDLLNSVYDVLETLQDCVIASFAGQSFGNYYGADEDVARGLYFVFPMGNRQDNSGLSYYSYAKWYTSAPLVSSESHASPIGSLDFCSFNKNGVVETWIELLECWYDNNNLLNGDTFY